MRLNAPRSSRGNTFAWDDAAREKLADVLRAEPKSLGGLLAREQGVVAARRVIRGKLEAAT